MARDIYVIAEEFRLKLLRGEESAISEVLRAYRAAERHVAREIGIFEKKLARAQAMGQDTTIWAQQDHRYREVLEQIESQTRALGGTALRVTRELQLINAQRGVDATKAMIHAQPSVARSFIQVPHRAIAELAGIMQDGSPLADLFHTLGPTARNAARDIIASGLASGENPRKMGSRLAAKVEDLSLHRATVITRNESLRAYRMAQTESYIQNQSLISGWRWLSGRDGRCCPICISRDGSVHSVSEPFVSHVGCRCTTVPVLRFDDTNIGTGEEWLQGQDEETQREVLLSPGRYQKWKDGTSLDDMVTTVQNDRWGPSLALVPLSDLP